ncbi:MAG: hypothetical protein JO155_00500 [Acidimicrobiia bacterium]|nr:hypothetical protein [Acidimicrobiia bacterium]
MDGVGEPDVEGRCQLMVDEAIVDLVGEVLVDQVPGPGAIVAAEHRRHLMNREQGRVALGDEILDLREALARPGDREGQEDTEQERRHAGQRDIDADVASLRSGSD